MSGGSVWVRASSAKVTIQDVLADPNPVSGLDWQVEAWGSMGFGDVGVDAGAAGAREGWRCTVEVRNVLLREPPPPARPPYAAQGASPGMY